LRQSANEDRDLDAPQGGSSLPGSEGLLERTTGDLGLRSARQKGFCNELLIEVIWKGEVCSTTHLAAG